MSPKVDQAVVNCLALSESARDPRRLSLLFLSRLAEDPAWSREEVDQVRKQVAENLAQTASTRVAG